MEDIILNELGTEPITKEANDIVPTEPSELEKAGDDELENVQKNELAPKKTSKKSKPPRALTILSLVFAIASLPFAFLGLVPFQIMCLALGLVFYIVDRRKNGKRGISLFGMICTLVTFVVIFITLVYSFILLGIGIYTVYVDPEPYNFVMGTLKGFVGWFLGIFGINFNF